MATSKKDNPKKKTTPPGPKKQTRKKIDALLESKPVGRPTKYKNEYCAQALKLSILGAIDEEMADFFDVSVSTLNLWKIEHPEFSESIKKGKEEADANVAASLYKRAIGYSHKDCKVFMHEGQPVIVPIEKQYPPDSTSAIFWLKNRQPKLWRDTKVIQGDADKPLPITWNEERTYETPKKGKDTEK